MSEENRARVGEIMDVLKAGLAPYVLQEYKTTYQSGQYLKELDGVLRRNNDYKKRNPSPIKHEKQAKNRIDAAGWLKAMRGNWDKVFQNKLGDDGKDCVEYLLNARNRWAHQAPLTNLQTKHIAEHATLLLEAIGANEQARITREIMGVFAALLYGRNTENTLKTSSSNKHHKTTYNPKSKPMMNALRPDTNNGRGSQVKVKDKEAQMQTPENKHKQSSDSSSNHRFKPDKQTDEEKVEKLERTSHADDAIQQLLRQHQDMMRHMQRQQASHLKTTASASTDVIQLLFRQNQEFMQHMQQMQASQPAASINADGIQLLIPLIHQNQALMQQASQSPASTSDDAVQQLMRQNQAFMQHMQQQQHMQTSQPIININPNISPNINPSISSSPSSSVLSCDL